MKLNWTIFALPGALAAIVAASSVACTVTTSSPSDAGTGTGDGSITTAECSANADTFSKALREADGGASSAAEVAACKACIQGSQTTCAATGKLSAGLIGCISECFAQDPDPSACIYTAGAGPNSCGTDSRFAMDYADNYKAWEDALFLNCEKPCQLDDGSTPDGGSDAH